MVATEAGAGVDTRGGRIGQRVVRVAGENTTPTRRGREEGAADDAMRCDAVGCVAIGSGQPIDECYAVQGCVPGTGPTALQVLLVPGHATSMSSITEGIPGDRRGAPGWGHGHARWHATQRRRAGAWARYRAQHWPSRSPGSAWPLLRHANPLAPAPMFHPLWPAHAAPATAHPPSTSSRLMSRPKTRALWLEEVEGWLTTGLSRVISRDHPSTDLVQVRSTQHGNPRSTTS